MPLFWFTYNKIILLLVHFKVLLALYLVPVGKSQYYSEGPIVAWAEDTCLCPTVETCLGGCWQLGQLWSLSECSSALSKNWVTMCNTSEGWIDTLSLKGHLASWNQGASIQPNSFFSIICPSHWKLCTRCSLCPLLLEGRPRISVLISRTPPIQILYCRV